MFLIVSTIICPLFMSITPFQNIYFHCKKRYAKRKDEELVKMSIGARRDMEEKMKIERNTLKEVLTNQSKRDLEVAVDRKKLVRQF